MTPIIYYYIAYSTYVGKNKVKFRAYKNFQIYLANYWKLLDTINNTNEDFEKLKTKISTYKDNITNTI